MLKRITFVCLFAAGVFSTASAQFKVEKDTLWAYGFAGTDPLNEIMVETHIIHTGVSDEVIKWERIDNTLPSNWESAVCDILYCRTPETDTGSFLFEAGDTGYLSFHFYTKDINASGKMVVRFSRAADPSEYVDIVIFGTAWKPVGIKAVNNSVATLAMPNPARDAVMFSSHLIEKGTLQVYNATGQLVMAGAFENNMLLDISNLSSGLYTVRINGGNYTSTARIIKE